ncbi:MAG: CAP domain-containing protein [Bacteroidota bacterium]
MKIFKPQFLLFFTIIILLQTPANAQVLGTDEQKLFDMINGYRSENGLPSIPHAPSLTTVAQFHVRDLHFNQPNNGNCNLHSWSSSDKWSACCYTSDHSEAKCMWKKPQELTSYPGYGYEIASMSTIDMDPANALDLWKNSSSHNAVILSQGKWASKTWKAMGVGIFKGYAVVWFGEEPEPGSITEPVTVAPKKLDKVQSSATQTNENLTKTKSSGRTKAAFVLGTSGNYIHNGTEVAFDSLQDNRFYGSVEGILGIKFGIKRQKSVLGIYGSTALFTSSDSALFDKWEYGEKYATQMEYGLGFIHRGWVGVMLGYGHRGRSTVFAELPSYYTFANMTLSIPIRRFAVGVSGKVILERNGFYVRNIQTGAHLRFTL